MTTRPPRLSSAPADARPDATWTIPTPWVFGVATALGLFSTLQAYRLSVVSSKPGYPIDVVGLLILNLALWYVPALLVPAVVRLSRRRPLDAGPRVRAVTVHIAGALTFGVIHIVTIVVVRVLLWGGNVKPAQVSWPSYVQRQFLMDLDWCLMTYAVIVGLAHAVAYHHESQARKLKEAHLETSLVEARLRTLEGELNPHFLFNTLHAISALVHRDVDAADRVISRLSDLLRLTLDRSGGARIPLKEEIDFLQKYLDIEQIRFADRLTIDVTIDPDALDAEVPRMILQPLVENAVKHGVAMHADRGHVQVAAGRAADRLWVDIRDDGGGLRGAAPGDLRTGVGLSNTRARLECLYGGAYRLDLLEQNGGLTVRLEIPFTRAATAPGHAAFRVA